MQDFAKLYRADDTGQVLATVEPVCPGRSFLDAGECAG